MKKALFLLLGVAGTLLPASARSFNLIDRDRPLNIYVSDEEKKVVRTAVELFSSDLKAAGDTETALSPLIRDNTLIAGTLETPGFDSICSRYGFGAPEISGLWEAYKIACVETDEAGTLLFVAGSDPRGTAYGILELSRMIGVSPWVWWADVTPRKIGDYGIEPGFTRIDRPSVEYRGIFLNDEDWGLMPWSWQTHEPSDIPGRIGPRTYSRIFELLLRLRANTIWPAMHEKTVPFFLVEGNKEAADRYGIVIGSSHCEPLLCNSAGEWDEAVRGNYNFLTNRDSVTDYWQRRLELIGRDNHGFLTIGMRGIHDGRMQGVKNNREYKDALDDVIKTQRELIAVHIDPDPTKVPQAFIPYKEVLEVYDMGLEVPEDVTLVWCDDNYGYLTRLSDERERQRKGGAGVYYHISYWGRPHDYLWLCSTQPGQIYSEMKKAWDHGARKLWIVNVGDIKPAEYDTEFFMDLAWDIDPDKDIFRSLPPDSFPVHGNISGHMRQWYEREFGSGLPEKLTDVMTEYYRLGTERKPEHMGWSQVEVSGAPRGRTPVRDTEFSPIRFGDEIDRRIRAYSTLQKAVDEAEAQVPDDRKDAWFQLVHYPVNAAAEMNKKLLYAQKARLCDSLYEQYGEPFAALAVAGHHYAMLAENAWSEIVRMTDHYNETLAGGKWNRMMDMRPRELYVFDPPDEAGNVSFGESGESVIWPEGCPTPAAPGDTVSLPLFVREAENTVFIKVFAGNPAQKAGWMISDCPRWCVVEARETDVPNVTELILSVDWAAVTPENSSEYLRITDAGREYSFHISALEAGTEAAGYETQRAIGLNACGYSRSSGARPVAGYGHSGRAVWLKPSKNEGNSGYLEYDVYTISSGEAAVKVFLLPVHPVNGGDVRLALSVDGGEPQLKSFKTKFRSEEWKENVLRNQAIVAFDHVFDRPGLHTIRITTPDEGVVVDQLMVDFEPEREFYLVPVK